MTDDLVMACPNCDTTGQVHERAGRGNAYLGNPDDPYACYECHISFAEPHYRPPKKRSGNGQQIGRVNVSAELLDRVRASTAPPNDD